MYPPGTLALVRRLKELKQSEPRREEAWRFALWIEGYPGIHVRPAVTRLFDELLQAIADEEAATVVEKIAAKKVKGVRGGKQRLLKRMMARVGDLEEWAELIRLVFAAAAGATSASSLRDDDVEPAPLAALLKIGGLPKDWGPPTDNLSIDLWATGRSLLTFLREVVATMDETESERVRLVSGRLARLAAAIEGVSLTTLPRHPRRTLVAHGVTITQDTIDLLLGLWRDIDIRLIFVPGIALLWRIAGENAEGWLSLAEAAVAMLPKTGAAESAAPQPAAVGDDVGAAIA